MESTNTFGRFKKFLEAYEALCKPYCSEIGLSVQAFEILMFLAKRKGITTAQDICKEQNIKPTLMSFHIEKLVQAGYVERQEIDGNRRSVRLICTKNAVPVMEKGAELYQKYTALIWSGIGEEERRQLFSVMEKINENAEKIISGDF